jgi:hypothetical protein
MGKGRRIMDLDTCASAADGMSGPAARGEWLVGHSFSCWRRRIHGTTPRSKGGCSPVDGELQAGRAVSMMMTEWVVDDRRSTTRA